MVGRELFAKEMRGCGATSRDEFQSPFKVLLFSSHFIRMLEEKVIIKLAL